MRKALFFLYGLVAYVAFLGAFVYAVAFVGGLVAPKTVDGPGSAPLAQGLLVNTGLLLLFAVQHSGMARRGFKRWWTRIVPAPIERSTYVLFSSLVLILLFALWRPLPTVVWDVESGVGRAVLWALFGLGWATVFVATFMIGHADLFGLRQVWRELKQLPRPEDRFRVPGLYAVIRHPIMTGFLIAFWATPTMTVGHLLFAGATTGYILVAVQLEERDLVARFGDRYRRYRDRVPAFLPLPGAAARSGAAGDDAEEVLASGRTENA
ncbi:MAG: NnrU family protein [Gemmatimonadota bacterium]|jgi:protein-S-isoprenylcysteine O-methyltransferase Ste14